MAVSPNGWGRKWAIKALLVPTAMMLAACGSEPPSVSEVQKRWLGFLQNGQTTRADVLKRLGIPRQSFEADRILTYRLGQSKEKGVVSRVNGDLHLILVFDERGHLAEHKLLRP